ncbi:MAG: DUF47 domain-containing protein [Thermoleophilaceae bacterium]
MATVPRVDFLALLGGAGENVAAATAMLDRLVREWPDTEGLRGELKHLEEQGDTLTHDILHQLHSTEETPLGRQDIHELAVAIDDIVDLAEETADLLGLYKIEAPMEQAVELASVLARAGSAVAQALASLDDLPGMRPHLKDVDRLEDDGDRVSRAALVSLFAGGIDPMVVIRWKDIFERLEEAIDACERVGHLLEGITVKST